MKMRMLALSLDTHIVRFALTLSRRKGSKAPARCRVGPDERVFLDHLKRGSFVNGVDRLKWRLVSVEWPNAVISVSAAARDRAPNEFCLRFEISGYPCSAPTAEPWDTEKGGPLDPRRWPTGRTRVPAVFNPNWKPHALYLPCDRIALHGHDQWKVEHPDMYWSSADDITKYLRIVHELLNSQDYTGIREP
jgi:hypothetical protein